MNDPITSNSGFNETISVFLEHIKSLKTTLPHVMLALGESLTNANDELGLFLQARGKEISIDEKETKYQIEKEHATELFRIVRSRNQTNLAIDFVPRSFVVTLVSQYDAYIGQLMRIMFQQVPDLLNASDKSFTLKLLLSYDSIEDARDHVAEKEIESLLRDSHSDQIKWFEGKLKVPLTKDLSIWPTFIELTERRNLFVHADGSVSRHYLSTCESAGFLHSDEAQIGQKLGVSRQYYRTACDCLFELGAKLGQVIWRKIADGERELADQNLNQICYDLIIEEEYDLAIRLLEFATGTIKKHSSEEMFLFYLINKAQAYRWVGKQDMCKRTLESVDWSAKGLKFKLVNFALTESYQEAARLMRVVGVNGEIQREEYRDWPAFKDFRRTADFLEAYRDIFGQEFSFWDANDADKPSDSGELTTVVGSSFSIDGDHSEISNSVASTDLHQQVADTHVDGLG